MGTDRIKLLIIDFNGVLAYGNYHTLAGWLARKYHREEKEIYQILYHKWFNKAAEGLISEKSFFEKALNELGFPLTWQAARKKYMSAVIPNKLLVRYLVGVQKSGVKILILSKNVPSQFREGVKICGLRKHFRNILNTFDLGLPKANRQTMLYIMKKFKVEAGDCVFIDDQDFNLVKARKLGIHTIVYKNFPQLKKELMKLIP